MSHNTIKSRGFLSRTIPFQWSLFGVFALLVVFISAATLTVSFLETARLVNDISNSLITRTQRQTEAELQRLFTPITNQVAVAHRWVQNGLVKRYDTDALMSIFLPGMFQLPQCVSMMVSDMHGYEFTIFRNESGGQLDIPEGQVQWTTRDFRREEWGKTALWTLWDENGTNRLKQWEQEAVWDKSLVAKFSPSGTEQETITEKDLIYDPRPRIWHQGPRDRYRAWTSAEIVQNPQEAIYWTDIDMFFTSKAPGITASIAVKDPAGELVVVAYDLLLRDLSVFTRELQPTEHGKTFVFTDTGKIVGLPRDERLQNEHVLAEMILKPVEDTGIPELVPFIKGWRARQSDNVSPFRFESEGQVCWAGFHPFRVSVDRSLWIGVVIPESDLLATARQNRITTLSIGGAALVLAMLLAWFLSQHFTRSLNALVQQSNQIAKLELSPGSPIKSRLTEVVQLSHSLNIMRRSLKQHITDLREAEEALRESESRYRSLFEHSPISLWEEDFSAVKKYIDALQISGVSDIRTFFENSSKAVADCARAVKVLDVNQNTLKIFKATGKEEFYQGLPHIFTEESLEIFREEVIAFAAGTTQFKSEAIQQTLTGEKLWTAVSVSISPGYEETWSKVFVSIINITERKQAEEQIRNQNVLLEQAVRQKEQDMEVLFEKMLRQEKLATVGQMAGSIAHELRNPLGAVKQSAFFLKRLSQKQQLDASNPKVQEHLELIEAELNTSERVISNLLQMTRMKPPQREQVDLRPIIEDAVEHCHLPEKVQLFFEFETEPFLIWTDPSQLRQMLINLLINAVQAIAGDGHITIRAHQMREDGSRVIEIEDDGDGIEPDVLTKIFDPLYTTKATGTGLGLSICKQIIDHHQGQISVTSQPGQGTTVTLVLPEQK